MCCAEGVSYDWDVSSVVWVVVFDSSVAVSSMPSLFEGCSSYPESDTLALDSKNCFQN